MSFPIPLFAAVLLAACSESTTTVEFAQVCKPEHDGKMLATNGYIHSPFVLLCRSSKRRNASTTTCSFDLRDRPDGEMRLSLNIERGRGKNQADEERLRARQGVAAIQGGDGRFLADRTRVRVSGDLRAVPNSLKPEETICWLDVTKIERM